MTDPTKMAPEVRAAPKDSNGDTDLSRCTREQLIELIRECQRALLDANENLMVQPPAACAGFRGQP